LLRQACLRRRRTDAVARTLEIPVENVRLICRFIGGGFGSKLWDNADAILAAIAARHSTGQ
jgi:xanthine dehydrogenase YagR molybdenum-binding subunit